MKIQGGPASFKNCEACLNNQPALKEASLKRWLTVHALFLLLAVVVYVAVDTVTTNSWIIRFTISMAVFIIMILVNVIKHPIGYSGQEYFLSFDGSKLHVHQSVLPSAVLLVRYINGGWLRRFIYGMPKYSLSGYQGACWHISSFWHPPVNNEESRKSLYHYFLNCQVLLTDENMGSPGWLGLFDALSYPIKNKTVSVVGSRLAEAQKQLRQLIEALPVPVQHPDVSMVIRRAGELSEELDQLCAIMVALTLTSGIKPKPSRFTRKLARAALDDMPEWLRTRMERWTNCSISVYRGKLEIVDGKRKSQKTKDAPDPSSWYIA
ncbi:hypothetical protein KKG41_01015 [Patescibacteria group bacterium]|nr:hypothetical protein [Patescibacteria group bacterium]MBU1890284.1 hypothetical protein [Patescibacteria group bacterium]